MQDKLGIIEPGELETIAAARRTLQTWEKRARAAYVNTESSRESFNAGIINEAATQADGRLFDVLNALATYADADIPADVFNARAPSEPQTPKRKVRAVVSTESDPPAVLGTHYRTDETGVCYLDTDGAKCYADPTCVAVVAITV